jgi:hypothetical protein
LTQPATKQKLLGNKNLMLALMLVLFGAMLDAFLSNMLLGFIRVRRSLAYLIYLYIYFTLNLLNLLNELVWLSFSDLSVINLIN